MSKKPRKTLGTKQYIIRVTPTLMKRVDDHLKWLKRNRPGYATTRSGLLRQFIQQGVEAAEAAAQDWEAGSTRIVRKTIPRDEA